MAPLLFLLELAPPTTNFRIFYNPSFPNGLANAIQFRNRVENDFWQLTEWFGGNNAFGPSNRVTVNLTYQGGSGSDNAGYRSDGSTALNLNGAPNASPVDDVIRMHFVAEFSEVLMSYNNQHGPATWDRGKSHGEGLSQFCAYMMAPAGYKAFYGPQFENIWLKSTHPDWVSNTEGTDTNPLSFACALLFLFYLHSQKGFDVPTIIRNGGSNLAETYTKLTGRADAFVPFDTLISAFFPFSERTAVLDVVNPFPLNEIYGRWVVVDADEQNDGPAATILHNHKKVQPFFTCPEKDYQYDVNGQALQLQVTAKTIGFGAAGFSWRINGMAITGYDETIVVPIHLTEKDPLFPTGQSQRDTTMSIHFNITAKTNTTCVATISLGVPYGKYSLDITVEAVETYANFPAETGDNFEAIDNSRVVWEQAYYDDKAACEKGFMDIVRRYVRANPVILRVFNQPDPPPEWKQAINVLQQLGAAFRQLEQEPEKTRHAAEQLLSDRLGLSVESLRGMASVGARLEPKQI
jgi:hypothetical protein